MTFETLLAEVLIATQTLERLPRRDSSAEVAGVVQTARATCRDILDRRSTLDLSRREATLLQDKLDRLQAQLRFFAQNPGGYEV